MKIINLSKENSVLNQFIAEIRDKAIQKDPMRFRRNLERIGEIMAYEISKTLNYEQKEVVTPLGIANCQLPSDNIVVSTVLRAGLPLHNGILNYFDRAQNAFVAAYRKYGKDNKFEIKMEYMTSPSLEGKVLIIADTMLAIQRGGYGGLFIEFKTEVGRQSPEQKEWEIIIQNQGYLYRVIRSLEEFKELINWYLSL